MRAEVNRAWDAVAHSLEESYSLPREGPAEQRVGSLAAESRRRDDLRYIALHDSSSSDEQRRAAEQQSRRVEEFAWQLKGSEWDAAWKSLPRAVFQGPGGLVDSEGQPFLNDSPVERQAFRSRLTRDDLIHHRVRELCLAAGWSNDEDGRERLLSLPLRDWFLLEREEGGETGSFWWAHQRRAWETERNLASRAAT